VYCEGIVEPGDVLYLTTDAMGSAMLALAEAGQPIWRAGQDLGPRRFRTMVHELRTADVLEDDDVTLVRVETKESP
jgi:frataxin-like iron-binding protein CyaY